MVNKVELQFIIFVHYVAIEVGSQFIIFVHYVAIKVRSQFIIFVHYVFYISHFYCLFIITCHLTLTVTSLVCYILLQSSLNH